MDSDRLQRSKSIAMRRFYFAQALVLILSITIWCAAYLQSVHGHPVRMVPSAPTNHMIKGTNDQQRWNWVKDRIQRLAEGNKAEALELLGLSASDIVNEKIVCAITSNLSTHSDEYKCYTLMIRFSGSEVVSVTIEFFECQIRQAI